MRKRRKRVPQNRVHALSGWFRLLRRADKAVCDRLDKGEPLARSIVIPVDIEKEFRSVLKDCCSANVTVWNRAVGLAVNGLARKTIIDRAMAARKEKGSILGVISSAVIYSTGWCASMMRKSVDPAKDLSELDQLQIDPRRRGFLLARQGCTIERGDVKFPGVGHVHIKNKKLFERAYSLHGRWTAIVMRGERIYVVIDAPAPLELLRKERTDYDTRHDAIRAASDHRTKRVGTFQHASKRISLLAKFGRRTPEQAGAQDE